MSIDHLTLPQFDVQYLLNKRNFSSGEGVQMQSKMGGACVWRVGRTGLR